MRNRKKNPRKRPLPETLQKKKNTKKDIYKKEGARPNPRLAAAAPSPSFPPLLPRSPRRQSKPSVTFLFISVLKPKPPSSPFVLVS
jgi:hypothetical protein